jgi:hypothetical protein
MKKGEVMQAEKKGSYRININESILEIEAHGPFDNTVLKQYQSEVKSIVGYFKQLPWGSLVIYHGNGIFSPEAELTLIEVTKYRKEHGMIANASVILNSLHADTQQMQLQRVYQESKLPFHVFSNIEHAKGWLVDYVEQQRSNVK